MIQGMRWDGKHILFCALAGFYFAIIQPLARVGADTVYLRNGQKIHGQVSGPTNGEITITEMKGTIGIPMALVDRVHRSRRDASENRQDIEPMEDWPHKAALDSARFPSAESDGAPVAPAPSRIEALDREAARQPSAASLRADVAIHEAAARYFAWHGEMGRGRQEYLRALAVDPTNKSAALGLGDLLIRDSRFSKAAETLAPAANRYPESAAVWSELGWAYYAEDHLRRAIAAWMRSLALRRSSGLTAQLARAEVEQKIEGPFQTLIGPHFVIRYANASEAPFATQTLAQMEKDFVQLERDFRYELRGRIFVLLYSQKEFGAVTDLPAWVRAANDGKILIPISRNALMTLALKRVLKHELTHSFVERLTLGRCPIWLDEGLAQLEEGASSADEMPELAQEFYFLPTYATLSRSFLGLASGEVPLVYAKSLAGAEYLRSTVGMKGIALLLRRLRANPDSSFVLRRSLRLDEAQFERAVYGGLGHKPMQAREEPTDAP